MECKIFIFSSQIPIPAMFFKELPAINSNLPDLITKFKSFPKCTYSSGSNFSFALPSFTLEKPVILTMFDQNKLTTKPGVKCLLFCMYVKCYHT